jgi:hypothetical protein
MYCLYGDASADSTDKQNGAGPIRLPKQVSRNSERADLAGIMREPGIVAEASTPGDTMSDMSTAARLRFFKSFNSSANAFALGGRTKREFCGARALSAGQGEPWLRRCQGWSMARGLWPVIGALVANSDDARIAGSFVNDAPGRRIDSILIGVGDASAQKFQIALKCLGLPRFSQAGALQ